MSDERKDAVLATIDYYQIFDRLLESVAANAFDSDDLIAALEFSSLYMSDERVSAISAGLDADLSPEEAVAYFVLFSAAVAADRQRRGFFNRLRSKFPPRPGSPEYRHLAMTNCAINMLLNGHINETKSRTFAEHYSQTLSDALRDG